MTTETEKKQSSAEPSKTPSANPVSSSEPSSQPAPTTDPASTTDHSTENPSQKPASKSTTRGKYRRKKNFTKRPYSKSKSKHHESTSEDVTSEGDTEEEREEVREEVAGLVELSPKGFGFLRQPVNQYIPTSEDVFIAPEYVRRHQLRQGQWVDAIARQSKRGPQLVEVLKINGAEPENYRDLPEFEDLTALNPNHRLVLETTPERFTTRVIDLMTPVGRGQRGLIVAPPRTGKTTLLQHIAEGVLENYADMKLMILLIDERPEEVTEFSRSLPDAVIMASSNDSDVRNHTRIAQMAIDRAKRLVEAGEHVFLLMDSITRMGRAFNNAIRKGGGRTMSGGVDIRALEIPRRIFAAARNTREAGSLTILATALIETGSRMDDLIFQEFKGTGNMELVLDRSISDRRVYPAVNIFASGTRREELLLPPHQLEKIYTIRRGLSGHKPIEAIERLLSFLQKFPNNAQMLVEIPNSVAGS